MSSEAWLCFGGTEIVNQARVCAYAGNGWKPDRWQIKDCCGTCGPEIAQALGELVPSYQNPGTDAAPWVSPTEPDSLDFGGLYVMDIDGLEPGAITRTATARANGRGSFLSPIVQASPVITVTGLLMGRTCCGVDYGLRWLRSVLKHSCGDGCEGNDLTFLDCCPEWCEDAPDFTSYGACMEPHVRTLKGVKLIQSPTITNRWAGNDCCCDKCSADMIEVTFQLSAESPCIFREPFDVGEPATFDLQDELPCATWVLVAEGECPDDCEDADDCIADPLCPAPPSPPQAPAAINACVCTPFTQVRACLTLDPLEIPDYAEAVPIIKIQAGSQELRQVQMQFLLNPLGMDPDDLDPCSACGEVTLSHIPAGATFLMDPRDMSVTITCPGSDDVDATPLLGSAGGRLPFTFPEIDCAARYTLCVTADALTAAADAQVSLQLAIREC